MFILRRNIFIGISKGFSIFASHAEENQTIVER